MLHVSIFPLFDIYPLFPSVCISFFSIPTNTNKTLFDLKLSKCLCRNSWRKNLAMKTLFSGLLVKTSGISQILKRYVRKSFWEIATRDIITVTEKLYLKDCYNYENFSFLLFSVFLSLFDFLIFSSNKVSLCDE